MERREITAENRLGALHLGDRIKTRDVALEFGATGYDDSVEPMARRSTAELAI